MWLNTLIVSHIIPYHHTWMLVAFACPYSDNYDDTSSSAPYCIAGLFVICSVSIIARLAAKNVG